MIRKKPSTILLKTSEYRRTGMSSQSQPKVEVDDIEDLEETTPTIQPKMMQQISLIKEMRKAADAPVDTMGCHTCADRSAEPKVFRFQTLVALMLSSQTKDQVTSAAMERLKAAGCTIPSLIEMPDEKLSELLKPVGFYKRKTEYLKKVCVILRDKYAEDIPDTFEGLCALPGVGPKMANLTLQIAFNRVEGIGVDTHVHRISNRLKWVDTTTPEQTEFKLREILPKSEWNSINQLLVGFGQTMCLPVNPKCEDCLMNKLCPSRRRKRTHT